jgi:hypothetical protein
MRINGQKRDKTTFIIIIIIIIISGVRMIGDGDCGEIGVMKIDRGNPSTRRKPAPAPLCPPPIPHEPGPPGWEASD